MSTSLTSGSLQEGHLRKELSLWDSVAITTGTIIGSGIFLLPQTIASDVRPLVNVILIWAVGGLLSLAGALSLAELGTRAPQSGGLYIYLRQAYGPLVASLYGWALLFLIHTGSIAALVMAFSRYANKIWGLNNTAQHAAILICVVFFTTVNCVGIRSAKLFQNIAFIAKCTGLGGLIVVMFAKGPRPVGWLQDSSVSSRDLLMPAMSALVAVMWAYEGWHNLSFVTGEMKSTARDLPRALFLGVTLVFLIYVVATVGYYHVLSPSEIRDSPAVAALAVGKLLGQVAERSLSILILLSICGSINGLTMTGPRVYAAMASEGLLPKSLGFISTSLGTPLIALLVQAGWVILLAMSNNYQQLFTGVIFASWIFYALGAGAIVIMRRRQASPAHIFLVPGYPIVPIVFCVGATIVVASSFVMQPRRSLIGLAILSSGIPVHYLQRSRLMRLF